MFRLCFQRFGFALQLLDDIVDADEVLLSLFQFPNRGLLAMLILRDAGDFVKQEPPFFGAHVENQVDLALLHDRIGIHSDAGVHEEFADIAQPTRRVVDKVAALTGAGELPTHFHLR